MKGFRSFNLPQTISKANPILSLIAHYIENSNILYSSVVYSKNNKLFLIAKNQQTPYLSLDWKIYCMMRSWAKTLHTSGQILKKQKTTFLSRCTFGDQDLEQLYRMNLEGNQNVVVCTQKMSNEEVSKYINGEVYNYMGVEKISEKFVNGYSLYQLIGECAQKKQMNPMIIEYGVNGMSNVFAQMKANPKWKIDLAIINEYEGYLPENSIGEQYTLSLSDILTKVWSSEKIPIDIKGQQQQGYLNINIYCPEESAEKLNKLIESP